MLSDKEAAITHVTWVRGMFDHFCDLDSGLGYDCGVALFLSYLIRVMK